MIIVQSSQWICKADIIPLLEIRNHELIREGAPGTLRPTEVGGRAVTPSQALGNLPSGLLTQHQPPAFTLVLLSSKCVTSLGADVLVLGG